MRLRDDPTPPKTKQGSRREKSAERIPVVLDGKEASLFEALRALRANLAREQNLPPYVVFHDSALREMVALRPTTLNEFARVPGVGETKLKRYGPAFLEVLRQA